MGLAAIADSLVVGEAGIASGGGKAYFFAFELSDGWAEAATVRLDIFTAPLGEWLPPPMTIFALGIKKHGCKRQG